MMRWLALVLSLLTSVGVAAELNCASSAPRRAVDAARKGPLTERESTVARIAWKYFENNLQAKTGLVNAVDKYPSTTMWDTASYIAALVSARELGVIDKQTFDSRFAALLRTLNSISFFRDELPNKVYHTESAQKVDYTNKPGEIGYSALDLGRLLIWLAIAKERYPEHANAVDRAVLRWDFTHVVDRCGTLFGAMVGPDKKTRYVQEGRLGYEEYAAKGFQLWGLSTCLASKPEPYNTVPMFCVEVPYDSRDPRTLSQHNYVVSESYVLDGVELGWDLPWDRTSDDAHYTHAWMAEFAQRIYQVQEARYAQAGILTARSEHQLDRSPYFVYDTIYSDGFPWNTITDKGVFAADAAAISLKAALGMWALWRTPYTDLLFDAIAESYDPQRGFHEGILESGKGPIHSFTANNNGIMLEALLFKVQGKLLQRGPAAPGLWERTLSDSYQQNVKHRPVFLNGSSVAEKAGAACDCAVCQDDMPHKAPGYAACRR